MFRFAIISAVGLVTAIGAYAGAIEIGGPSGITANYVTQGGGAVCAAGAGNCVTGSTGGWTEKNFDNVLFAGATNGVAPVPFSGYVQTGGEASGLTATSVGIANAANGQTFAMISDGAVPISNASKNLWEASAAQTDLIVPIGVFDVTGVATMLQNAWGTMGGNDTDITFNFGNTSNATTGLTSVTFDLINTNNAGNTSELRAALACITVTTASCNATNNPHNTPSLTTTLIGSDSNSYGFAEGFVFGAAGTFGGTYNYTSGATGVYAGTQGTLKLDDQDFNFGNAFLNKWLVSVDVGQTGTFGAGISATALSAITVTAVPEPTTFLLLLAGFGGVGVVARRLRKA